MGLVVENMKNSTDSPKENWVATFNLRVLFISNKTEDVYVAP